MFDAAAYSRHIAALEAEGRPVDEKTIRMAVEACGGRCADPAESVSTLTHRDGTVLRRTTVVMDIYHADDILSRQPVEAVCVSSRLTEGEP